MRGACFPVLIFKNGLFRPDAGDIPKSGHPEGNLSLSPPVPVTSS
jgi:hypothetical protein